MVSNVTYSAERAVIHSVTYVAGEDRLYRTCRAIESNMRTEVTNDASVTFDVSRDLWYVM